ncbi:MAG: penicillin-binding protein 2 [Verrucomicrobia bacterium]|jgi:cell division protein FtsI/penicillin-binding protein 2|nr:penicillin-binding protein 2 [Verrucomicrobiota bacterium]
MKYSEKSPEVVPVQPLQLQRMLTFTVLLMLGFCVIIGRLIYIQVYQHEQLLAKAQQKTQRTYLRETERGKILDRQGVPLAINQRVRILCANLAFIDRYNFKMAKAISEYLEVDEERILKRLKLNYVTHKGEEVLDPHVRLKVKVTNQEFEGLKEHIANYSFVASDEVLPESEARFLNMMRRYGVFVEPVDDFKRIYPNGTLAAHTLGFTQSREEISNGYTVFLTRGIEGIEKTCDDVLSGVTGWRQTELAPKIGELREYRNMDIAPRSGLNVILTLDSGLQSIVEEELLAGVETSKPKSATVILVRPQTGEILAMASYPNYDPNQPVSATLDNGAGKNRAIMDQFEPGSTFKIVSISSALSEGTSRLTDVVHCNHGQYTNGKWRLSDDHGYGDLSVLEVFAKSSNIGTYKIIKKVGQERFFQYIMGFGFGQKTGVQLPGELAGKVHHVDDWRDVTMSRVAIGYTISVTPLQITMAMAAIANGGRLMQPMIIDRIEYPDGKVMSHYDPHMVRQVMTPESTKAITKAMTQVVGNKGTARRAKLDDYTVAGKTGTARKIVNGRYTHTKHLASFVGFLPAESPEICMSVLFNEPEGLGYGGIHSAPVFKAIAQRAANYLNLKPSEWYLPVEEMPKDLIVQTQIVPASYQPR